MSVSYLFAPKELRATPALAESLVAQCRLRTDPPLQQLRVDGRYVPVSIANWKLIPSVARSLLSTRIARPLTFADDRRLTVVIPYRDREAHLQSVDAGSCRKALQEQRLNYRIVVVEQETGSRVQSRPAAERRHSLRRGHSTDYYCLHDVDAVPVVANYACPSQPLRLVNKIIGLQGKSRHNEYYFSGAVSIRKDQVQAAERFLQRILGLGQGR